MRKLTIWSPRSQACKTIAPILEKLVRAHNGKVRLVRMDVDAHPAIASQLRVQHLPTVYAFVYRKEEPTPPSGSGEPAADDGSDLARAEGA